MSDASRKAYEGAVPPKGPAKVEVRKGYVPPKLPSKPVAQTPPSKPPVSDERK